MTEEIKQVLAQAVSALDAEHDIDPDLDPTLADYGCRVCYPKDTSWPCVTRQVADDLRAALGAAR